MQLYRTRLLVLYTTVARSTKRSAALVTHPSYFVATSSLPNKLSFVRTMVATRRSMATTTALPATPKRKRKVETSSIITPSPRKQTKNLAKQKTEKTSNETTSPNKKTTKSPKPPADWEQIYSLVEELRQDRTAPCDESGCEALPDRSGTDRDFRFQALISLMLSSQTKDATVGEAIRRMQEAGVLNVQDIAGMDAATLNSYINKVGFHNNKTKYIKQSVDILIEKYDGDIPPTAKLMMDLPGVGPKMAFICENVAWNKQSGIGVDTHMHRLFNKLRWVQSNNPEQTRMQLEAWLPEDKWKDVNLLWVGFGQEVQQFQPKIVRKALDCTRPAEALRLLKRCGLNLSKVSKSLGVEDEVAKVLKK